MTWRRRAAVVTLLLVVGTATWLGPRSAVAAPLPDPAASPPAAAPPIGGTPCLPVVGCDPLGGLAGGAADTISKAVFDTFDAWVADGATAVLGHVASAMNATTQVDLNASWFADHFGVMRGLAVVILLPMFLVGLIDAVIRRDAGRLVRAAGVYLPVAVLGSFAAIELTDRALQATDAMSSQVAGDLATNSDKAIRGLVVAIQALSTPATPGVGNFLTVVVLLLVIAGAFLIWIELLIRSSAIYVVVLFLPIVMSGLVWPATARWTRRLIETLVALILSKFVIVAVISLAAGALGNATGSDKLDTLMAGAALLLLAAFAPFSLLRLIPMVEAGAIAHLERLERRPIAAATRATMIVASQLIGAVEAAGAAGAAGPVAEGSEAAAMPSRMGGELNDVRAPGEDGGRPASPDPGSPAGGGGRPGSPDPGSAGGVGRPASPDPGPPDVGAGARTAPWLDAGPAVGAPGGGALPAGAGGGAGQPASSPPRPMRRSDLTAVIERLRRELEDGG